MSGTAGGKYILTFELDGAGEKDLENVARLIKGLADTAGTGKANVAIKNLERSLAGMSKGALSAKIGFIEFEAQLSMVERGLARFKPASIFIE